MKRKPMKNMVTIGYQEIDKEKDKGFFDYIIREQLMEFTEKHNCSDEVYSELWKAIGTITGILNGLKLGGEDCEE